MKFFLSLLISLFIAAPAFAAYPGQSPKFGTVTVTTGVKFPTSGGTASTLADYEEGTFSASFTGPGSSGSKTISFARIGKLVILGVPSFTPACSVATFFTAAGALPSRLRPATATLDTLVEVTDNSAGLANPGFFRVSSSGDLILAKSNAGSAFTASGTCGITVGVSVAYTIQ